MAAGPAHRIGDFGLLGRHLMKDPRQDPGVGADDHGGGRIGNADRIGHPMEIDGGLGLIGLLLKQRGHGNGGRSIGSHLEMALGIDGQHMGLFTAPLDGLLGIGLASMIGKPMMKLIGGFRNMKAFNGIEDGDGGFDGQHFEGDGIGIDESLIGGLEGDGG